MSINYSVARVTTNGSVTGINAEGQITLSYADAFVPGTLSDSNYLHEAVDKQGTITQSRDAFGGPTPGAFRSAKNELGFPSDINSLGVQELGGGAVYEPWGDGGSPAPAGFGVNTPITGPTPSGQNWLGYTPYGINDLGEVVGVGYLQNPGQIAFVTKNGVVSQIKLYFPGATNVTPYGISDNNIIVGAYQKSLNGNWSGFAYHNGLSVSINVPGAISTVVTGINPQGTEIVGTYEDANQINHGFVDLHGLIEKFDVPGASNTFILGVNAGGQVVGTYTTAAPTTPPAIIGTLANGFVATPTADLLPGYQMPTSIIALETGIKGGVLFNDPNSVPIGVAHLT